MEDVPGFGWTTPSASRVILHPRTVFIDAEYGDFVSSSIPAELVNLVSPSDTVNPQFFAAAIGESLAGYFGTSDVLKEELEEFYSEGKSNDRVMRWHLMKIAPNTSFRLHAHQNIELIYVIKGTMHEIRLASEAPKRIFPVEEKDGPNLSDPKLSLKFTRRHTTAPINNESAVSSADFYKSGFLINEKGSIHMSYTMDDGAELLVLWSGGHGNIPAEQYPVNAAEVLELPADVTPF